MGTDDDRLNTLVDAMAGASTASGRAIQRTQTRFRMAVVDSWGFKEGDTVLEIGCGQGDMTAVLAAAVGASGRVVAVDSADPSYGAPVTLGESAAFLGASPLGSRIDFRFGTDVLDPGFGKDLGDVVGDGFDHVVLSHCSWYFDSGDQLRRTLDRARQLARRLCFAEWDLRPTGLDQLPHLLAVLVQGQTEASGARGTGNIRAPFSREQLGRTLDATGWQLASEETLDVAGLQDADWEIANCRQYVEALRPQFLLTGLQAEFLDSQLDLLNALARDHGNTPLPSYALTATH